MTAKERASYLSGQCRRHNADNEGGDRTGGRGDKIKERLPFNGEMIGGENSEKDSKSGALFLMNAKFANRGGGGGGGEEGGEGGGEDAGQSSVLVCAPPHSAAKAVFDQINDQVPLMMITSVLMLIRNAFERSVGNCVVFFYQMGKPCKRGHGGKIEGCDPGDDNNTTVSILLTR